MQTGKRSYPGKEKLFKTLIFMPRLVSARFYETICMHILNGTALEQMRLILLCVDVSGSRCVSLGRRKHFKVIHRIKEPS